MNTTQQIAIDFCQRSVSVINAQLAVEIQRNHFSLKSVRASKVRIERKVISVPHDSRACCEVFSIGSIVIMIVEWKANGFSINVSSDEAIQKRTNKKVSKKLRLIENRKFTKREIDIERIANEYEDKELADAKKTMKI